MNIIRSSSFKLAALISLLFTGAALTLFGFVYWQTISVETLRIERELTSKLLQSARSGETTILNDIGDRITMPGHKLNYAELFSPDLQPLTGNIPDFPAFRRPANAAMPIPNAIYHTDQLIEGERVMMVGLVLKDRRILVYGRSADSIDSLAQVLPEALIRGIIPAVILAMVMGVIASRQSHARLKELSGAIERIMQGNLQERLPTRRNGVEIDHLTLRVNSMLDEIEQLVDDAKSTGGNIAHDLRTPLTRVRTRLERACQTAQSHGELMAMVEQGIAGLDQALRIITALLRIGQIENGVVRSQFTTLDLRQIVHEVGELYEPFAEEKNITFQMVEHATSPILGDWELLNEAIVNLVDNALKFAPVNGQVRLEVLDVDNIPVVRVIDNGPGIPDGETEFIWNRFYRSEGSTNNKGHGLGLSIVRAIVQLHGFTIAVHNRYPGCEFVLSCQAPSVRTLMHQESLSKG